MPNDGKNVAMNIPRRLLGGAIWRICILLMHLS